MILLHATSGRGPEECCMALQGIVRAFLAESGEAGLRGEVLQQAATQHGLSSALLSVEGAGDTDFAESWQGSIVWVCKSVLRPNHGRKRWFVGVTILPAGKIDDQTIREADLVWETMRSSGPGGQHVNRTESAVRVTHKPTGIILTCQEERSQHRNKAVAISKLRAIMAARAADAEATATRERWDDHNSLERGAPIRIYKGDHFKRVSE